MTSNCSEIGALFIRLGAESHLLADAVLGLAELAGAAPPDDTAMVKLQAFDAIVQLLQAQGRLFTALAPRLVADVSPAGVAILLDDIPLPAVRDRLRASLGLTVLPGADFDEAW